MATHFLLLSYRFDMSTGIFHEPQDVSFPIMYGRNCHPKWYQKPNFQGLPHGLLVPVSDVIFCVDISALTVTVLWYFWCISFLRVISLLSHVPSYRFQIYVTSLQCSLSGSFYMESCKCTLLCLL